MKKIIAILLAMVMSISCFGILVSADTGYYSKTVTAKSNSQVQTRHNFTWTTNAKNGWVWGDAVADFSGYAASTWYGTSPFNADNISLSNIIHCDKILGSFSVGPEVGMDGPSVGITLGFSSTSTDATYTYSVSNRWKLDLDFAYQARCGGLWLYCNYLFETTSLTQLGSNFYQLTTESYSLY